MSRKLKWIEAPALQYPDKIPQKEWDKHKEEICTKIRDTTMKEVTDFMKNHRGFNAR
jgi:hypothetical protein